LFKHALALRKVALTSKNKRAVMRVCVLGAGIVGLATAYSLHRAGHEVTVVDRATPGSGASGGNGAQLSYSYVQPLADPGIWRQLPKLLLSPSSPLKLRPRLDIHQWLWGARFLAACNSKTSREHHGLLADAGGAEPAVLRRDDA
jgi:D-amino-acid dehydrogenase